MFDKKLQKKRLKICMECEAKSETKYGYICNHCRCFLKGKTLLKGSYCPRDNL